MKVFPCFKNKHTNSIRKEEKMKVKSDGEKGKRKRRDCCGLVSFK
jgi:hypothetical protein